VVAEEAVLPTPRHRAVQLQSPTTTFLSKNILKQRIQKRESYDSRFAREQS
jgi:hypothetical protein